MMGRKRIIFSGLLASRRPHPKGGYYLYEGGYLVYYQGTFYDRLSSCL